ncbi:PREDICTED: uncharacterized protein LOC102012581 [Chinchilla lanigera]|uniref:uncharacterized protein LOC102012581 n=1 Tax=Chinchilla lanigera TaxID=34839 RepID=UPI00069889A7|nr:PREDICTED: uncharacterized protein LOC102012581 [Chinchilla lanigera]
MQVGPLFWAGGHRECRGGCYLPPCSSVPGSYQHLAPSGLFGWGRRYSEPPFFAVPAGTWIQLPRRASEPSFRPSTPAGWARGRFRARWAAELGLEEARGSTGRSLSASSAAGTPSRAQEPQPGSDLVQELSGTLQNLDLTEGRQDSRDVVCGICRDRVWDKPEAQRVFGILPNCSHAYCLGCLRTWRQTPRLPLEVIKACPQCRVYSSYIIPYKFWVSEGPEKEQLIRSFTARTRSSAGSSWRGTATAPSDPAASTCTSSRSRRWPPPFPVLRLCNWSRAARLEPTQRFTVHDHSDCKPLTSVERVPGSTLFLGPTRQVDDVSFPGRAPALALALGGPELLLDLGSSY